MISQLFFLLLITSSVFTQTTVPSADEPAIGGDDFLLVGDDDTPPVSLFPPVLNGVSKKHTTDSQLVPFWSSMDNVIGYSIEMASSDDRTWRTPTNKRFVTKGSFSGFLIKDLQPDTVYGFRVKAEYSAGTSEWSDYVTGRTKPQCDMYEDDFTGDVITLPGLSIRQDNTGEEDGYLVNDQMRILNQGNLLFDLSPQQAISEVGFDSYKWSVLTSVVVRITYQGGSRNSYYPDTVKDTWEPVRVSPGDRGDFSPDTIVERIEVFTSIQGNIQEGAGLLAIDNFNVKSYACEN